MSRPTKRMRSTERGTSIGDQQSAHLITSHQHSGGKSPATTMSSPTTKSGQLKDLEFELAWKTRDEIFGNLNQHTALLSGLIINSDCREKLKKSNGDLIVELLNLPLKVDSRSGSFESLERSPGVGWNEVLFELNSDVRSRIVDTLMTNHEVTDLQADSVSNEQKANLINRNSNLICELVKLRVRTGAISSDSSMSKGDHLIDPATKASESPATSEVNNTPATCIEDLPPEMIRQLFEHLHPKDLVACSMVNKRWHSIYAGFKMHRLVTQGCCPDNTYLTEWYGSNQQIQEEERCSPWMFRHLAEKPLLTNLRQLALSGDLSQFNLTVLNRFRQLVHLEIYLFSLAGEVHLNLPKLRLLRFHKFDGECALSIDCPELSTLAYSGYEHTKLLKVKHPETIRKLVTDMVGPKLAPFKGVECLVTWKFEAISKATLIFLPALRELCYNRLNIEYIFSTENVYQAGGRERMKRTLSEFVDEAKRLRGSDFQFTFVGLQLTDENVDQIDFGVQADEDRPMKASIESFYLKNYHLIKPGALDALPPIDYNRLMSGVTGELPRCFFQKFTNIKWVEALTKVADTDHFLWFLKSLRFLEGLELESTEFSQEFYDQLPTSAPSLISLRLRDRHCEDPMRWRDRHCKDPLQIGQPLSLESFVSVLRSSAKLEYPSFEVLREHLLSIRRDSTVWKISNDCYEQLFQSENPDEIVDFLKGFRA